MGVIPTPLSSSSMHFSGLAPQQDPSYDMPEYHTDVLTVHTHCMAPYQLLPPSYHTSLHQK